MIYTILRWYDLQWERILPVPFVYVDDLMGTVDRLKEHGIVCYGEHLDGQDLYAGKLEKNNAFLIGK